MKILSQLIVKRYLRLLKRTSAVQIIGIISIITLVLMIQFPVFLRSYAKDVAGPSAGPTPTPGPPPTGQITKKVLVLNFDPLINGTPLHSQQGWSDPITLQNQYVTDIKNISHQFVNYQIVNTQTIRDYPYKANGFKFTQQQYLDCVNTDGASSPNCPTGIDYIRLINDYNLCGQSNSGTIDEVWLWGGPWMGYWEAIMAGSNAFYTNAPPITGTSCTRGLHIMGFNYERGAAEMLHNLGHRTENTMWRQVYGSWAINLNHAWNRFSMPNKDMAGKASCGNIHFPYNGTFDYNYANQTNVVNRCANWLNYPSTTGATVSSNCSAWGCTQYGYMKYWFTRLPHATGTTNNKLNNWWKYVVDYDNAFTAANSNQERWHAIENGNNDYNTSCGTNTGGSEVYFGINAGCSPATNYSGKFNFPGVQVARNATITEAFLEFVVDGPYSNAITENIILSSGTTTAPGVSWPITSSWTFFSIARSPSLVSSVQQLVNSASWTSGNTINVSVNHVSGTGSRRVFAFEREAMAGARLVIKTGGVAPTATPTPRPSSTSTPTPILPTIQLFSPLSGASSPHTTGPRPPFVWSNLPVGVATGYHVQISTSSTFSSLVFPQATITYIPTCSGCKNLVSWLPPADLARNITHYWRVRAYNSSGNLGPWSVIGFFTPTY